jgi:hypothetical protein
VEHRGVEPLIYRIEICMHYHYANAPKFMVYLTGIEPATNSFAN